MICTVCSKEFQAKPKTTGKYCSLQCWYKARPPMRGSTHPSWKGGRYNHAGYVRLHTPHGKQVLEHRLVMEGALGRPLFEYETVHHINGNKSDNRIENLELWTTHQPKGVRVSQAGHCPTCSCRSN